MNIEMDCSPSDIVLDLRKTKSVMDYPEPMKYSPPPAAPVPTYAPLTPPYYSPPGMSYQPQPGSEYRDDISDRGSCSPPAVVTSSFIMANNVINAGRSGKPTRPFKAYPKDPLALSTAPSVLLGHDSNEEYRRFRKRMMAQLNTVSNRNNANMKRSISPQMPSSTAEMDEKTAAYWARRRKNNEAAKRSRDARRAKEDELAIRAAYLEQENVKLKYELAAIRNEMAKLRCLVYKV